MMKKQLFSIILILAFLFVALRMGCLVKNRHSDDVSHGPIQQPGDEVEPLPDDSLTIGVDSSATVDIGRRIAANAVRITNMAPSSLTITIEEERFRDTFKIRSMERWVSGAYSVDPKVFIKTSNTSISYKLDRGRDYILYWNHRQKRYDLRTVEDN